MATSAGAMAVGSDFQNLTVQTHDPLDSGTTTSTTFTTTRTGGTSPVGVAFTVPPSGKVKVHWAAAVQNSTTSTTICSIQLQTGAVLGAGTSILSGGNRGSIQQPATTAAIQAGKMTLLDGLTPGDSMNVTMVYRVSGASTGTISLVEITVDPCIA